MISNLNIFYQELFGATMMFLPKFISGILILLLFFFIYLVIAFLFKNYFKSKNSSYNNVIKLLKKSIFTIIAIIGLITALGTWGVNVSAIVTGLGLTGFAVGLALKDALSNTLSGMLIVIYKPFKINDIIECIGAKGVVKSINMRYTILEDDSKIHLLPNSKLLSEKVTIL